jgi:hypothetical protein
MPRSGVAQVGTLPELTTEELVRYDRHLLLPQVGVEGQRKLKATSILLIGAGFAADAVPGSGWGGSYWHCGFRCGG